MPTLEVITPDGRTEFHDLDPARGVTNIGRHPDNDIVLDGPGVTDFHVVLDHRRRPYQVMLLGEGDATRLQGRPLPANAFQEMRDWDTLEIAGYSLILLEGAEPATQPTAAPPPVAPAPEPPPEAPLPPPPPPVEPVGGESLLTDRSDPLILAEISGREWTIEVEQTAACQVTVTNGGDIVAAF